MLSQAKHLVFSSHEDEIPRLRLGMTSQDGLFAKRPDPLRLHDKAKQK
jgi:hypothetical protein